MDWQSLLALLKLLLVFSVILFALRKKIGIGIVLLLATAALAILFWVQPVELRKGLGDALLSTQFVSLTAILVLVSILGALLKQLGFLQKLAEACDQLIGGKRTAVVLLPSLVGSMPMPGGSQLSAPLVDKVLDQPRYSPLFRCVSNYWFRHMVEFSWPIYPGLVLTEAVTGVPVAWIAFLQLPLTIFMLGIGYVLYVRRIEKSVSVSVKSQFVTVVRIVSALWPVAVALVLYGLVDIDLSLSLLLAVVLVIVVYRPGTAKLKPSLRAGLSLDMLLLVVGILSFQTVLRLSHSIDAIPIVAESLRLPGEVVIFAVCFTIGLLTSMSAAVVGLGYTLLGGLLYTPELRLDRVMFGYLCGFTGMLLSPTHLCTLLTTQYFGVSVTSFFRALILPVSLLFLLGLGLYLTPWGALVFGYATR